MMNVGSQILIKRPVCLLVPLFFVCVPSFLDISSDQAFGQASADLIAKAEQSVVRIEVESDEGKSMGSGFVVASDGIIVTNSHVISGATKAVAFFPNGKSFPVIGTRVIDHKRDIAIAKIDTVDLPTLELASYNPRKGEVVIALGSPLGLSFTATKGIVSAQRSSEEMKREMHMEEIDGTWIQVDAALSPGNSGGPLINETGQVVAMSTLASQGIAQNLNFGICVDDIRGIITASFDNRWDPLALVAAKSVHPGMDKHGGEDSLGVEKKPIPSSSVEAYVAKSKKELKNLSRGISTELSRIRSDLKSMKEGSDRLPPELTDRQDEIDVAIRRATSVRGGKRYFFNGESVKRREVSRIENQVNRLASSVEAIKSSDPNESILAVMTSNGPALNVREQNSIGFMKEASVILAIGDAVMIEFEGNPYLLMAVATTGIYPGQELQGMPVFVGGVVAMRDGGRIPLNLTLLVEVSKDRLSKQLKSSGAGKSSDELSEETAKDDTKSIEDELFTNSSPQGESGEVRQWNDRSGKFSILAKFVSADSQVVTLKRNDGKVLTVPLDKLSDADRQYLKSR